MSAEESKTTGYHLFLEPEGDTGKLLQDTIDSLAATYGGPEFPPHLTVLARIPGENESVVCEKALELSEGPSYLTVSCEGFGMQDSYFKSLYLVASPTDELLALHKHAQELFTMSTSESYVPHISLMYGTLPTEQKKRIIETLGHLSSCSFTVQSLSVWRTPGETSSWTRVATFPLLG